MKAVYRFVNGDTVAVEVEREIYEALVEMERQERNSERRETRRHVSLDALVEDGAQFGDGGEDALAELLRAVERAALREAISMLLPEQQELIHRVYFRGESLASIARNEGVHPSAVSFRLSRIHKKIQKILK